MRKKPCFLIIVILFTLPLKILAYDTYTTHPILTGMAVDFYNLYSSEKITETEKQLIMKGSTEEDNSLRFVNHFYDPVFNKTWHFLGVQYLFPELTAKQWAKNPFAQALYDPEYLATIGPVIKSPVFSNANYSWQRAIYEYVKGNRIKAFESLGHILHLIQDMSVPEHTRENVHLSFLDKATSYYEEYAARKEESFYQSLKDKLNILHQFPLKNNLEDYFDNIAFYSNNYFLSPDTIPPSKYKLPRVEYQDVPEINKNGEIEYFLLSADENGNLFHLAKKNYLDWRLQSGFAGYTLNDSKVLNDYFKRLGLKSVLTSAGVINLYFKEIEKVKLDPNFVKKNEKNLIASIFEGINSFIADIFQKDPEYILKESDVLTSESTIVVSGNQSSSNLTTTSTTLKSITTTLKFSSTTTKAPSKVTTTTKLTTTTTKVTTTTRSTTTTKTTTTTIPLTSFCSFNTTQSPLRNKVIFNEIAWMGTVASSDNEWIELKNISNQEIDISGWQILDKEAQIKIVLPLNTKIGSNQFFLLERTDDNSVPQIKADFIFVGTINNQNEALKIFDNHCQLQDEVISEGDWFFGNNTSKRTMERKNDLAWQTSSEIGGTPTRENSAGYFVNSGGSNSDSDSSSVSTTTTTTSVSTTTTEPISYPKILINEIKIADKDSENEIIVKDEFIELYNPNNFSVDLTNWYIQKKTKEGDSFNSLVTKSVLEGKLINPEDYFVIGNILSPVASTCDALWADNYSLAKDNTIALKNPLGEIVDKVGWGEVLDSENLPIVNPEPQQSIQRKKLGEVPVDTDNNFEDFEILECPTPKELELDCEALVPSTTSPSNLAPTPSVSYLTEFSWHPFKQDSSQIILDFRTKPYPFIPSVDPTDNSFTAMVFYLHSDNNDPSSEFGIPAEYLGSRNSWVLDAKFPALTVTYPNCQGYTTNNSSSLIFTNSDRWCHAPGVPWGLSYYWWALPKDNHFLINVVGTNNGSGLNFTSDQYVTIGYYGHTDSRLKLITYDPTKFYFNSSLYYHRPTNVTDFGVQYKENNNSLIFSWTPSTDEDFKDVLTYDIHYTLAEQGDNLANNNLTRHNWEWSSSLKTDSIPILNADDNKFYLQIFLDDVSYFKEKRLPGVALDIFFGIKALDNEGLNSEIPNIIYLHLPPII